MDAGRSDYDVLIIGAGLVGLALAAALARTGLAVALVDRSPVAVRNATTDNDWDARVYAVSPGSAEFLHSLGAWQHLPCERLAAIEAMDIRGDAGGALSFSAYELGERALAWIVENRELNAALVATVRMTSGIDVLAPCQPTTLSWRADVAQVALADSRTIAARLIVGADGVRSWTRQLAGLSQEPQPYSQTAVVANFATELPHRGRAFQWFLADGGVLAWLPLPGRRISIVWSAPVPLARELCALDAIVLASRMAAAGGNALGALTLITPPTAFPLFALKLPTVITHRLALVGDAAHGVHPLAGQGVNLGFGDAAVLAAVLAARGPVADAGAPILLERYARRRAEPVLAMQTLTDGLARLFGVSPPWIKGLRNRGMRTVDALGILKKVLARPALR